MTNIRPLRSRDGINRDNSTTYKRFQAGESVADLARELEIPTEAVEQIIRECLPPPRR